MSTPTDIVSCEGLAIGHGRKVIMDRLSFALPAGKILAIVGPSGCGKSTLMRSLSGLDEPLGGKTTVLGVDLATAAASERAATLRRLGFLFQGSALFSSLTLLENVELPMIYARVPPAERRRRALESLERVGLGHRAGHHPSQLSGGQQQRVGIARSLAVEPDIWLLDEPFSALDPLIRKEMQDEFLRLQGLLQKTILFVTHDFEEALRLADRIAIMKDGVIEQLDTPANIVLHPATDYVAKFTRDVPREKVLSCANLMEPLSIDLVSAMTVHKDALIATVAEAVLSESHPVQVVDDAGKPVGLLNRKTVLHVLFGARGPQGLVG